MKKRRNSLMLLTLYVLRDTEVARHLKFWDAASSGKMIPELFVFIVSAQVPSDLAADIILLWYLWKLHWYFTAFWPWAIIMDSKTWYISIYSKPFEKFIKMSFSATTIECGDAGQAETNDHRGRERWQQTSEESRQKQYDFHVRYVPVRSFSFKYLTTYHHQKRFPFLLYKWVQSWKYACPFDDTTPHFVSNVSIHQMRAHFVIVT